MFKHPEKKIRHERITEEVLKISRLNVQGNIVAEKKQVTKNGLNFHCARTRLSQSSRSRTTITTTTTTTIAVGDGGACACQHNRVVGVINKTT